MQTRYDVDHIRRNVYISYRPSAEWQNVRVRARWARPNENLGHMLPRLQRSMQQGFGGDAQLDPASSHGEWVQAPHLEGKRGPTSELDAILRVRCISEWFARYLVALLVPDATELTFVGELPIDHEPACLDTERFLARDAASNAYPARVAPLPFEFQWEEAPRGAALRVDHADAVPRNYATGPVGIGTRMPELGSIMTWLFWDRAHDQAGVCSMMPRIKLGARETSVLWPRFAVQPEALVNILTNQLVWVHRHELPIERVLIHAS